MTPRLAQLIGNDVPVNKLIARENQPAGHFIEHFRISGEWRRGPTRKLRRFV